MIERKQVPARFTVEYDDPATGKHETISGGNPADVFFAMARTLDSFWLERGIAVMQLALESEREADAKREAAIQALAAKLAAECNADAQAA